MRTIQIFLGGGVKLLHGENEFLKGYRNDVIDPILSQLNSRELVKHLFVAKDYTDLTRNVVPGKHQDVYNAYITHEAKIALFIVDGEIGNITKHEIDVAVASTKAVRHPIVFVYGKNIKEDDEVLVYLNQEGIYYQHFYDNRNLAAKIKADLEIATKHIVRTKRRNNIIIYLMLLLALAASFLVINIYYNHPENKAERNEISVDNKEERNNEIESQWASKSYEIELLTIVNTYVQAYEHGEYHNVDWGVFAQKPLTPLTRNWENAPKESGYSNVLRFKGKLQYNRTPMTTYKTGEAADWIVSLYGSNAAPNMMRIEADEDGMFGSEDLIINANNVAKQAGFTLERKTEDMISYGYSYLYKKNGLYLFIFACGGSAGISLEIIVSADIDDINRIEAIYI